MKTREEIISELCQEYDKWEKTENDAIARGCGARGSNGDLTGVPFDTLFNEVVWKIKFGLNK